MFTKNSEIDIENNMRRFKSKKPTIADKRIMIKERLDKNFPSITVLYYTHVFIGIGLTAIGLQIALISNKAVLYRMGNGIWGGCFAIINGLIKLFFFRERNYSAFVFYQTMTFLVAIGTSIGLVAFTGVCLAQYPCDKLPACSIQNQAMTIVLHVVGHLAVIKNIVSVLAINIQLFGGWRNMLKYKLGFFEAYRELFKGEE